MTETSPKTCDVARAKPRLAVLVNIVAPYRVPVYEALGEVYDALVLYSGREDNRTTWTDTLDKLKACRHQRAWGLVLRQRQKRGRGAYYTRYKHLNPGYLWWLLRFRPHAILTSEMGFRSFVAWLYGKLTRTPVWIWWGGTICTERSVGPVTRWVRGRFARARVRWVSYGATSTTYLGEIGVERDRILQIQNCVDERLLLAPVEPAFSLEQRPVLLVVGQLVGLKGLAELIRAAAFVQAEGHTFSLVFAGDGQNRTEYESLAKELGLRNCVFLGGKPPEALPAIYRSADCLMFATLGDVWGLVVNEAMWSGLPVLCSIYAGCAEELVDEADQFDPLDPVSLQSAVRRAALGLVGKPDRSKLKTHREVSDLILADLARVLEGR